jgi:hypothetical protein
LLSRTPGSPPFSAIRRRLNFSPQMPALSNCARRISNLSGGCTIFRPPLADRISENEFPICEPENEFSKTPKLIQRPIF